MEKIMSLLFILLGMAIVFYDLVVSVKKIKRENKHRKLLYLRVVVMGIVFVFFIVSLFFLDKKEYIIKYVKSNDYYNIIIKNCKNKEIESILFTQCNKKHLRNVYLLKEYYKCMIFGNENKCEKFLRERRIENEFNLFDE